MLRPHDMVKIEIRVSQAETVLRILKEARDMAEARANGVALPMEHRVHMLEASELAVVCRVLRIALSA